LYLSISEYNEMFGENSIQEQSLDKIESVWYNKYIIKYNRYTGVGTVKI
jgi:hypothetical protein